MVFAETDIVDKRKAHADSNEKTVMTGIDLVMFFDLAFSLLQDRLAYG